ncbi:hypothetical protein TTHERM_01013230 (macronuclear) [Tetrahymena thermophila SB210]|uniref:Uncharacterized protein n=1 Tax=Tetrahymena thermophila (strain SB210) TaxID=312017 RepID=Q22L30_TETTS|nr:hypothetical protein TTHERM_01013230 [Tetrahymena thermophila SB210]EAR85987.1 hypothetical protein TTHERM_01013230 [Tetrahymena thermophila SB210]|eukprot:XP_976582.1 hypothetical protein TTHERM_01013230 [Tetrahymena thermophila SB210]
MNDNQGQVILDQHSGFLINTKLKPKIQHLKQQSSQEVDDNFNKTLSRSKYFQNTFQQPSLAEIFKKANLLDKSTRVIKEFQYQDRSKSTINKNNIADVVKKFSFNNCLLFKPAEKPQQLTKEKRSIQVIKNNFEKREKIRAQSAHQKKLSQKSKDVMSVSKRKDLNQSQFNEFKSHDRSYILDNENYGDDMLNENSEYLMFPIYTEPDQYQTFAFNDEINQIQQNNTLSVQGRSKQANQVFQRYNSSHSNSRSPISNQNASKMQQKQQVQGIIDKTFHLPENEEQLRYSQTSSPYFEQMNSSQNQFRNNQDIKQNKQKIQDQQQNENDQFQNTVNQQHILNQNSQINQIQDQGYMNLQTLGGYHDQNQNQIDIGLRNDNQFIFDNKNEYNSNNDKKNNLLDFYQENKTTPFHHNNPNSHLLNNSQGLEGQFLNQKDQLQWSIKQQQKNISKIKHYSAAPIIKQQILDENQYQMILQTKQNYIKNYSQSISGVQSKGKSPCNINNQAQTQNINAQSLNAHANQVTLGSQLIENSTELNQEKQANNDLINNSVRIDDLNLHQIDWGKIMKKEKPIHSNNQLLQKNQRQVLRNINNQKFKFIRNASMLAQQQSRQLNNHNQASSNNLFELSSLSHNVNYAQSIYFFQTESGFRPQTTSAVQRQRPTTPQTLNNNSISAVNQTQKQKSNHQSLNLQEKNSRYHSVKSTNPIQDFIQKQTEEDCQELDILKNPSYLQDPNTVKDAINSSYNQSFYLQKTDCSINEGRLKTHQTNQSATPSKYQKMQRNFNSQNSVTVRPSTVSQKRQKLKQTHQNIEQSINSLFRELGIRNNQQPSPLRINTFQ